MASRHMEGSSSQQPRNNESPQQPEENLGPKLSQDMMIEVVKRLPAKSVGRFRCVSKFWRSFLSSSEFARTHLSAALDDNTIFSQRQRLLFASQTLYTVDFALVDSSPENAEIVAVELDFPLKDSLNVNDIGHDSSEYEDDVNDDSSEDDDEDDPDNVNLEIQLCAQSLLRSRIGIQIWGSYHGLLCFAPDVHFLFLFNPCTGQSKRILDETHHFTTFGFGYIPRSDDYKVLEINLDRNPCSVYSLRNDCWREINVFLHDYCCDHPGVFLGGVLYWVAINREGRNLQAVFCAFDLENEVFSEMAAPRLKDDNSMFMLGIYHEQLCLLESFTESQDGSWMMYIRREHSTWTSVVMRLDYTWMKGLCSVENGEAVVDVVDKLVQYDLNSNEFKEFNITEIPIGEVDAAPYLESLISPNNCF